METAEVLSPVGDIEQAVMFPADSAEAFAARIAGYITDAESKTANVAAQKQWVYYRAFNAVHLRIAALPNSASMEEGGSYSYLLSQVNIYRTRATEYLAEFNKLIAPVVAKTVYYPTSGAVSSQFTP